jgi:hypothetical protein
VLRFRDGHVVSDEANATPDDAAAQLGHQAIAA